MNLIKNISLTTSTEKLSNFFQLLEQGFLVDANIGCSLRDFICGRLELDRQYLEESVQTIFLDHTPIDDLDAARIRTGSTVALSAAMPGLAGATLRIGGRFAVMRKQLSCGNGIDFRSGEQTTVTVKFFNRVAEELGKNRLENGIRIQSSNFIRFVDRYIAKLPAHVRSVRLDGETIEADTLTSIPWQEELFLQVSAA